MKKYNIHIEKTVKKGGYISVKADSKEEAKEKAKNKYDDDDLEEDDGDVDFSIESVIDLDKKRTTLTKGEILSYFARYGVKYITEDYVYYRCDCNSSFCFNAYIRFKNVDKISPTEEKLEHDLEELINLFESNKKIMDLSFEKLMEFDGFVTETKDHYHLYGIYLDKDNKNIVATNGRILNAEYREELSNCSYNYIIPKSIIGTIYNDIEIYDLSKKDKILIKVKNGDFEYDIITDVVKAEYSDYKGAIETVIPKEIKDTLTIDINKEIPEKEGYEDCKIYLSENECSIRDEQSNILEESNCLSLKIPSSQESKHFDFNINFNISSLNKLYRAGATYIKGKKYSPFIYKDEDKESGNIKKILLIIPLR